MNFQDKVFQLRMEIVTNIRDLILEYGETESNDYWLDCWNFRPANTDLTLHLALYNRSLGLRFETEDGKNIYQSEVNIDVLAGLADILHLYYNKNNSISK